MTGVAESQYLALLQLLFQFLVFTENYCKKVYENHKTLGPLKLFFSSWKGFGFEEENNIFNL